MATGPVRGQRARVQLGAVAGRPLSYAAAMAGVRYKCPACDVFYTQERVCVGLPWSPHESVRVVPVESVPQPDTIARVSGGDV